MLTSPKRTFFPSDGSLVSRERSDRLEREVADAPVDVVVLAVAAYVALTRWLLPKLGIQT
jgi:hypothetical protein